jgi:hypothetical protein
MDERHTTPGEPASPPPAATAAGRSRSLASALGWVAAAALVGAASYAAGTMVDSPTVLEVVERFFTSFAMVIGLLPTNLVLRLGERLWWGLLGGLAGLTVGLLVGLVLRRSRAGLVFSGGVACAVALAVINPGKVPADVVRDWTANGTLVWSAVAALVAAVAWAA